jgi:uncharacterized protein YndB with AHSA1/START domain
MPEKAENKSKDFVISRVLNAPRDLVWQCFTRPERMKEWWGPKGVKIRKSEMDLRVGGTNTTAWKRRTAKRCGAA